MKFRKKPVEVEAMQLTRHFSDMCVYFVGRENINTYNLGEFLEDSCFIDIKTLEGVITAKEGDWIIKGYDSENGYHFWPCKNQYFIEHYEQVKEAECE